MKKNSTKAFISLINVIFITFACMAVTGCAFSRTVTVTPFQAESRGAFQLPISTQVEIGEIRQENPNPVTPVFLDKKSLKEALTAYLNTRNVFNHVLDGRPDSVLSVSVRYRIDGTGGDFIYTVILDASLISKDGMELGKFSGQGVSHGGSTRFSAGSDHAPINESMRNAISSLCLKIEESHRVILAKLGHTPSIAVSEKPLIKSDIADIPVSISKQNKNAYAVVIGIENYRQKLPKADFAVSDAKLMAEYLTKALGYPEENVITLINENATKSDFEKYIEEWLPKNFDKNGTLFIYYSGHGAPNPKTGDAFLVPYDGDPNFIEKTGYPLKKLYDNLSKLQAKEVIVALDSCFSGAGGKSVLAEGSRPLVMNLQTTLAPIKNMIIIAASSGSEISSTYKEKGHGLFTYFLLKGIKGEADTNEDGKIEINELYQYLKPQVQKIARKFYNNEQTPQLIAPEAAGKSILLQK